MRILLASFSMMLSICICGCAFITEQDLADLQSPNAIVKKDAIHRISAGRRSPLGLMDRLLDRGNEKRAAAIMVGLLRSGKESKDTELDILKALGQLGKITEVPVSALIDKLKDKDPAIRAQTSEALGKIKDTKAAAALVKLLEEEPDNYAIIWALGEIGDQGAVPALNRLLGNEDKCVTYNAHRALAKIGNPHAVEADPDNTGLLDIASTIFKKYQDIMMVVFGKIAGLNRAQPSTS
jgi:HEAT repeat protein